MHSGAESRGLRQKIGRIRVRAASRFRGLRDAMVEGNARREASVASNPVRDLRVIRRYAPSYATRAQNLLLRCGGVLLSAAPLRE